jgi:hypothetical protein
MYQALEEIEFVGGIFVREKQRLLVLGMLLENLGIDQGVRFAISPIGKQPLPI